MLSNIMKEQKGVPFLLIRKRKPTLYHPYIYETEYAIFYDYTDNKYYRSGNEEELKETYTDKQIQAIFNELTPKANKKIKLPESKIYLKFDKPNQYEVTEWEIHNGIGVLTAVWVECGAVTEVTLLTYYPDWRDVFGQPREVEYEFNHVTSLIFEEVKE